MIACTHIVKQLALPNVIINKILTFCSWSSLKTAMWYIIASHIDATYLHRAKEVDQVNQYLASDDESDMFYIFKRHNDSLIMVEHIKKFTI